MHTTQAPHQGPVSTLNSPRTTQPEGATQPNPPRTIRTGCHQGRTSSLLSFPRGTSSSQPSSQTLCLSLSLSAFHSASSPPTVTSGPHPYPHPAAPTLTHTSSPVPTRIMGESPMQLTVAATSQSYACSASQASSSANGPSARRGCDAAYAEEAAAAACQNPARACLLWCAALAGVGSIYVFSCLTFGSQVVPCQ